MGRKGHTKAKVTHLLQQWAQMEKCKHKAITKITQERTKTAKQSPRQTKHIKTTTE